MLDDNVETGLTINFASKYLQKIGYSSEKIYVFAKEGINKLFEINPLSYYKEKIEKTNNLLMWIIDSLICP